MQTNLNTSLAHQHYVHLWPDPSTLHPPRDSLLSPPRSTEELPLLPVEQHPIANNLSHGIPFSEIDLLNMVWERFEESRHELDFDIETPDPTGLSEWTWEYHEDFRELQHSLMQEKVICHLKGRVIILHREDTQESYLLSTDSRELGGHRLFTATHLVTGNKACCFLNTVPATQESYMLLYQELKRHESLKILLEPIFLSQSQPNFYSPIRQVFMIKQMRSNLQCNMRTQKLQLNGSGLPSQSVCSIILEVLEKIHAMQGKNIFHGCLTPKSILLTLDGSLRIYYSLPALLKNPQDMPPATDHEATYLPPEYSQHQQSLISNDAWSICAIAFEMLTLEQFSLQNANHFIQTYSSRVGTTRCSSHLDTAAAHIPPCQILHHRSDLPCRKINLKALDTPLTPTEKLDQLRMWANFMHKGLDPNPNTRATVRDLLSDPLFQTLK